MNQANGNTGGNAIVIGASMAGLLTARILADHFGKVTLLERDTFPAPGLNRKGVPQGRHIHVLLERGRQVMETYFPGLSDTLAGLGAVTIPDTSLNVRWFHSGAYHQPGASGFPSLGVSRPTLEAALRERVLQLPNVQVVEDVNVTGLLTTSSHSRRVTGVSMINRRTGGGREELVADLVVDASGRGSRTPIWLEELGYQRPEVEEVRVGMGYATCFYPRQLEQLPGIEGIVLMATPPDRRLAVLLAQDGNRWVLTIGGYLNEHVPTDYQGYLRAARDLPTPDIYNLIKDIQPLGEPVAYKFPANLRHHYESLASFPEGFLVIGDALCSFNPIYGQGMTVAALESVALRQCLAEGDNDLTRRFFVKASEIIDDSWNAAVGTDLGFAEIEGPRTPMVRFLNWYMGKVHIAAHTDALVSIAFLKVINMLAAVQTILHPRIIWHVLKGNLWPAGQEAGEVQELSQPRSTAKNGQQVLPW
jgi:2-polyprenyl-6-methoxyphenol hydroxylase-like FAD-dependent oxidoreductase